MIKISKLADYAVVTLAALARSGDALMNVSTLAGHTGLPEPTVAKVLKLLSKDGVVQSIRGASGGYGLARAPQDISIAEILLAVEGPVSLTACIEGSAERCDYGCHCLMKGRWNEVNSAIQDALEGITLADMMKTSVSPAKAGAFKISAFADKA